MTLNISKSSYIFYIHGIGSNGSSMLYTAGYQKRNGLKHQQHIDISYEPTVGLQDATKECLRKIERIVGKQKCPIDLVCHSMGGLIALGLACTGKLNIQRVCAVASPIRGVDVTHLKFLPDQYKTIASGSPEIENLNTKCQRIFSILNPLDPLPPPAQPHLAIAASIARMVDIGLRKGGLVSFATEMTIRTTLSWLDPPIFSHPSSLLEKKCRVQHEKIPMNKIQCLMLYGTNDPAVPKTSAVSPRLLSHKNCSFIELKTKNTHTHLLQAKETNELINTFLKGKTPKQ